MNGSGGTTFKVTTHVEYTKALRNAHFVIGCAKDNEQLASFFEDKQWRIPLALEWGGKSLVAERDFRVNRVRVNGADVPIIRTENTQRGYEVWCGTEELAGKLNRQVRVAIEDRDQEAQEQRALLRLPRSIRPGGWKISFRYGGNEDKKRPGHRLLRRETPLSGGYPGRGEIGHPEAR